MRKPVFPALALAGSLLATSAFAQDYQFEVRGGYDRVEPDRGPDADLLQVSGSFYLEPVQTRSFPLAEAAFLDRASVVSAFYAHADAGRSDSDAFGLGTGLFVDNLYFAGEVYRQENDFDDDTSWGATVGVLPTNGLLLRVGYDNIYDDHAWILGAKLVHLLGGERALNLTANVRIDDDYNDYTIGADYYLDRTLSVGGAIGINEPDRGSNSTDLTLAARKFFTPTVSGSVSVTFGEDAEALGLAGTVRF